MKKYIILILLPLFISCVKNYSVYTECKDNTIKAMENWQEVEEFNFYISRRENTADIMINKWNKENTPLGAYYGHGVIDANDNYRTIAHEIGHFLDYEHSDNSNSIMYKFHQTQATQFIDLRRK